MIVMKLMKILNNREMKILKRFLKKQILELIKLINYLKHKQKEDLDYKLNGLTIKLMN